MPRPILFSFQDQETSFGMNKVDRARLYGYRELEVLDEGGRPCQLATLADDGRTLVGKGGTGIGYLTADGNWCEKEDLRPVDLEGETIQPVPSSFAAPIPISQQATFDDYLSHNIRLVYEMELPENGDQDRLVQAVLDGAIFKFSYSYRGGLEADTGFLLANQERQVFLLIGDATELHFVGLQQAAVPEADDTSQDVDDLMDFGMI